MKTYKSYSAKPSEITHDWYVIDAAGQTLGRLATLAAAHLIGKHKPLYTAHLDCGDNVVVINAAQIKVTGNKMTEKMYYHHSGYPGGLRETNLETLMQTHPTRAVEHAISGMLPKNRLQDVRMKRLKVYAGTDHPHAPQNPKTLGVNNG